MANIDPLEDPTHFHGTDYVWVPWDGANGRWRSLADFWVFGKPSDDTLGGIGTILNSRPEYRGMNILEALLAECMRLRGDDLPPTPANRIRYDELADKCMRLDADLRRKRAECDELRDRIVELEKRR